MSFFKKPSTFGAAAAVALALSPAFADAQGNPPPEPMAGEWFVKTERAMEFAMFGAPETDPAIALTCDPAIDELIFALSDESTGLHRFTLAANGATLSLDLSGDRNAALPYLEGRVDPSHAVIAAMVRAGQTVTLTYPDGTAITLPADPAIAPVVEACS